MYFTVRRYGTGTSILNTVFFMEVPAVYCAGTINRAVMYGTVPRVVPVFCTLVL